MKLQLIASVLLAATLFQSCKKDDKGTDTTEVPSVNFPSDHGDLTLSYGGQTMKITGTCEIVTTGPYSSIRVTDGQNPDRTITFSLGTFTLPIQAGTYHFYDEGIQPPANGIHAQLSTNSSGWWSSNAASGSVTYTVAGNEVIAEFNNVLQPHEFINTGAAANPGTLTGKFKCDIQ